MSGSSTFTDVHIRSRYIRIAQAIEWYPFKRGKLYQLLTSGDVRSFVLKQDGARRGIRLIDRDSLDDCIEAKAVATEEHGN